MNQVKWVTKDELRNWIKEKPEELSAWIKKIWDHFLEPNWERWTSEKHLDEQFIPKEVINLL